MPHLSIEPTTRPFETTNCLIRKGCCVRTRAILQHKYTYTALEILPWAICYPTTGVMILLLDISNPLATTLTSFFFFLPILLCPILSAGYQLYYLQNYTRIWRYEMSEFQQAFLDMMRLVLCGSTLWFVFLTVTTSWTIDLVKWLKPLNLGGKEDGESVLDWILVGVWVLLLWIGCAMCMVLVAWLPFRAIDRLAGLGLKTVEVVYESPGDSSSIELESR